MAKWKIDDNSTGSTVTWTFAINPNESTLPDLTAQFSTNQVVAPNGQRLRFQGQDSAPRITFSGAILAEAEFTLMKTNAAKRYPLTLTDDLGTAWNIVIIDWTFQRVRRHSFPWRIDYTATVELL